MTPNPNPKTLDPLTQVVGTDDMIEAVLDLLRRRANDYRGTDLNAIREFEYGDPNDVTVFPSVAVVPDDGDSVIGPEGVPGTTQVEKKDRIILRLYYEVVEGRRKGPFKPVTRTLDYLRVLFYEHRTLETKTGVFRVFEAWPARWAIRTFIERDRQANVARCIRGAELTLEVRAYDETIKSPYA